MVPIFLASKIIQKKNVYLDLFYFVLLSFSLDKLNLFLNMTFSKNQQKSFIRSYLVSQKY